MNDDLEENGQEPMPTGGASEQAQPPVEEPQDKKLEASSETQPIRGKASVREPTPEEETEPEDEQGIGKDELNLVEYPLALVANRVPKRKKPDGSYEEVKTIQYEDWVTINGERRPQRWIVTGSDAHGLPTGADNDIFLGCIEAARKRGFKDNIIPLQNAYKFLKAVGNTGGRAYQRFARAIPCWAGLSIHSENALYDRKGRRYIARYGFNLFQEYKFVERERTKPAKHGKREPVFYGYLKMSDYLFNALREGNIKDLDLSFYKELPNPLTRRLYRFLDKKRWYGGYFSMDAKKLCLKLGFDADALQKYRPAKIRNLLTFALDELVSRGFLTSYEFRKTLKGQKLCVYFAVAGTRGVGKNPFNLTDEQLSYAQVLVEDMAEGLRKAEQNRGFYFKTSAEAVRDGKEWLVRRCVAEVKAEDVPEGTVKDRSALFHHKYTEAKKQLDLPFGLRGESDSGSAKAEQGN